MCRGPVPSGSEAFLGVIAKIWPVSLLKVYCSNPLVYFTYGTYRKRLFGEGKIQ